MSHEVENTWNRLWSETLSGLDAYIIIAAVVGLLAFLMLYLGSARSARS